MRTGGQDPGVHMSSQQLQLLARWKEKDPGASLADSLAKTHELQTAGKTLPQKNKAARGRGEHSLSSGLHLYTDSHLYTCVFIHSTHTHTIMDYFVWQRKFQDSIILRLWYSYCSLCLVTFTVRIQKQNRKMWKCNVVEKGDCSSCT